MAKKKWKRTSQVAEVILTTFLSNDLHILLPNGYVGEKIELLLYATEELDGEIISVEKLKSSDFAGSLSKEDTAGLLKHVAESRNEWERDI